MNRDCPVCSCDQKTLLFRQDFSSNVIAPMEDYDVAVCADCGFVYADNIPLQAEFDAYYASMSKYEFHGTGGLVSKDYLDYYARVVRFLMPHVRDKNAKILDIGCSTGGLLSVFKSQGYTDLLGLDPSPSCAKAAKGLHQIDVAVGNISDFSTQKKFDLIVLTGVMEHLADFDHLMPKIRSLLNDHGFLFAEVPDAERFEAFISAPFQQFSIEHINYFSRNSLKNLLARFSFETAELQQGENRIARTVDPDILILARKTEKKDFKFVKDATGETQIKKYIDRCSRMDREIRKVLEEKLSNVDKIIVWGTGTHTLRLISAGLDLSKVLFFVDSNVRYTGKELEGLPIKLPGDIKEKAPILVSTYSYQQEIISQIRDRLKLKNEIITLY